MSRVKTRWSRVLTALQYAFLLLTFVAIIQANLRYTPKPVSGQAARSVDIPAWKLTAIRAYNTVLRVGRYLGVKSVWRMYTPVPTELRKIEWYARSAGGDWVTLQSPDVGLEYRARRSLTAAVLWDFKRARVNDNYFIYRPVETLPEHYMSAMRPAIVKELGEEPEAIRVVVFGARIPPPDELGDWTPETAEYTSMIWQQVFQ